MWLPLRPKTGTPGSLAHAEHCVLPFTRSIGFRFPASGGCFLFGNRGKASYVASHLLFISYVASRLTVNWPYDRLDDSTHCLCTRHLFPLSKHFSVAFLLFSTCISRLPRILAPFLLHDPETHEILFCFPLIVPCPSRTA